MSLTPSPHKPSALRRLIPALLIMPTIGLVLSGLMTWINVGYGPGFGVMWLKAFVFALPVLPLGLLVMGLLQRMAAPIESKTPAWMFKCVLALGTAIVMETLVSTAVTYSNHGLSAGFTAQWAEAFLGSLPVGLAIGLTMSFVIRPRLIRWMAPA